MENIDLESVKSFVDTLWVIDCAILVFIMQAGFMCMETGLSRHKNSINVALKNAADFGLAVVIFWLFGFGLMFGKSFNGYFGTDLFFFKTDQAEYMTYFVFQAMFVATAATIVSGAVAERIKLQSFMLFTVLYVGITYPIVGSWNWEGGFLDQLGFYDFAGSTLVHSVGGWAALIAVFHLGARIGKFNAEGKAQAIMGHNIPLAAAGVLILWLGWFGFNGGSVLSADPELTSLTLVNTCLAASAGVVSAAIFSNILYKNFDITMFMNGILGGLVGITADADQMSPSEAILIGLIAGVIIVLGVAFVDRLKLDDPVGAIAVHLICGIWGTLAVGLFGALAGIEQIIAQLTGIGVIGAFSCFTAFLFLYLIKALIGLRVDTEEELRAVSYTHLTLPTKRIV